MNMKENEVIAFMSKHDIEIPNPIPTKSVLLKKILIILKNIAWISEISVSLTNCTESVV